LKLECDLSRASIPSVSLAVIVIAARGDLAAAAAAAAEIIGITEVLQLSTLSTFPGKSIALPRTVVGGR